MSPSAARLAEQVPLRVKAILIPEAFPESVAGPPAMAAAAVADDDPLDDGIPL